jgi:hypothetical protein
MTGRQCLNLDFAPGRMQFWIRLALLLAVACAGIVARAASFTATLDHDTILLGDTATLSLRFDDGQPSGPPQLPELPGLQVVSSGQSSQFGFSTAGRSTSSVSYNFGVRATEPGEFVIPALSLKVGGETLTSQPIKFKVVRATAPQPGSEAEQQSLALLRFAIPKKEAFVGETIVVEQQLLIRSGVQNVPALDIPALEVQGCVAGKAVQGPQRQTVIGSTPFTVVPFQIPLTVMRAGRITIGPVSGTVVVELPAQGGRRDPFDPFGMLSRVVQQRVAVTSDDQSITGLALPDQGRPASFTGAVGQFDMAVSAGPTNVAVGDPVTLRIEIHGQGSLDAFTLPDQPGWKEFKVYPPTVKTETTGELGLSGTKSFEEVVVPMNTEIRELPAFTFAYFDPERRADQTLKQPATPLLVRPAGSTPSPTLALNSSTAESHPAVQDIVHIKARPGPVIAQATPWVSQTWFLVLQGVPVLALIGAVLWRRRCDRLDNNPRLRRQRQVEQMVREGVARLQQAAVERNSDEFFAGVFRLIQEQVGEKLDLPASAITEAVVEDKLRQRGLGDDAAQALHELFQLCNQARYSPVQSLQEMEAVIPKLEAALQSVREVPS